MLGAVICREDGIADPAAVTRELVRRAAERGVEVREGADAAALEADTLVIACGAGSPALAAARGIELPIRPLCRQLVDIGPVPGVPADLPMTVEGETGFHFRRVGREGLRLAMTEPHARWGADEWVDDRLVEDWRRAGWPAATRPPPARRSCARGLASTT